MPHDRQHDSVFEVEVPESGYVGGKWFDEPGTYLVPASTRMREAIRDGLVERLGHFSLDNPVRAEHFISDTVQAEEAMHIIPQDLSTIDLTVNEDGWLFRHDGSSKILADGDSTTAPGYYQYDDGLDEFRSVAVSRQRKTPVKSGDATNGKTAFTISHGLGTAPSHVQVTPRTEDAMADLYVPAASRDANSFDIVYEGAPPDGVDNLEWDVTVVA